MTTQTATLPALWTTYERGHLPRLAPKTLARLAARLVVAIVIIEFAIVRFAAAEVLAAFEGRK
jgi:hypothetical protein